MPTSNAKTQKSRHDTAVQGTNDSSIVSKCSMARYGYFRDDFLHRFVAKEARRAPLIHRGYFIRARAIDYILREFLKQSTHQQKQIISLGAGFDSCFFRLGSEDLLNNTVYIEVDFPEVVRRKGEIVLQTDDLKKLVKIDSHLYCHSDIVLNTDCYKLIGVDLNDLSRLEELLRLCRIKGDNPTLLLSECVLTYMTAISSTKVIRWANEKFDIATFVLYEQINPDDAFGQVMLNHFTKIGSPLQCIQTYPTRHYQLERFKQAGWGRVEALDMNQFYHHLVTQQERRRICDLEPFDEYEEWHLKCAHYLVLCAYNNDNSTELLRIKRSGARGDNIDGELLKMAQESCCRTELAGLCDGQSSELCDVGEGDTWKSSINLIPTSGGEYAREETKSEQCSNGSTEKKDMEMLEKEMSCTQRTFTTCGSGSIYFSKHLGEVKSCRTSLGNITCGESDTKQHVTISKRILCILQPRLVSDDQNIDSNSSLLLQRFGHSSVLLGRHVVTVGGFGNHGNKHCRLQNGVVTDMVTGKSVYVPIPEDFKLGVLHGTIVSMETEESILLLGGRYSPVKCNKQITKLELTFGQDERCAVGEVSKLCDTTEASKENFDKVNLEEVPGHVEDRPKSSSSMQPGLAVGYQGNMDNGRWRHTSVKQGAKVYVYGGRNETSPTLGECLVYDLCSHSWSQIVATGQSPGSRHSHTAALWNGHMVIAGGVDQELSPLNSIHLLDTEKQHWVDLKLTGHLKPRYSHTCHVVEDFLILVGGVNLDHTPPGLAVVNLTTGECHEFDLPRHSGNDVVMYHKHSSIMMDSSRLMVIGGGGNCFSFGTHINSRPVVLDIRQCLRLCQGQG